MEAFSQNGCGAGHFVFFPLVVFSILMWARYGREGSVFNLCLTYFAVNTDEGIISKHRLNTDCMWSNFTPRMHSVLSSENRHSVLTLSGKKWIHVVFSGKNLTMDITIASSYIALFKMIPFRISFSMQRFKLNNTDSNWYSMIQIQFLMQLFKFSISNIGLNDLVAHRVFLPIAVPQPVQNLILPVHFFLILTKSLNLKGTDQRNAVWAQF